MNDASPDLRSLLIIIINGIYIAPSSQVATLLGNGAANALKASSYMVETLDVWNSYILKVFVSCAINLKMELTNDCWFLS